LGQLFGEKQKKKEKEVQIGKPNFIPCEGIKNRKKRR
jgi:hypothetical protein